MGEPLGRLAISQYSTNLAACRNLHASLVLTDLALIFYTFDIIKIAAVAGTARREDTRT